jgi:RimJ/RimL family protein N-acetyltransferase
LKKNTTPPVITLREAQFSDHAAIAKLHADSWRRHYRGILSDHYLDHEVEKERMDTWYERLQSPAENQFITLAIGEDTIAGFCCFFLNDDPFFGTLIDNFHVGVAWQRSGIGTMLLRDAAKKIDDKAAASKMYLWVFEANTKARLVYERLGGTWFETVEKENEDGTVSATCRYTWDDLSKLV